MHFVLAGAATVHFHLLTEVTIAQVFSTSYSLINIQHLFVARLYCYTSQVGKRKAGPARPLFRLRRL
jgi:hypothetical protein